MQAEDIVFCLIQLLVSLCMRSCLAPANTCSRRPVGVFVADWVGTGKRHGLIA